MVPATWGRFTKGKKSYAKLKIPRGELPQNDRMRCKWGRQVSTTDKIGATLGPARSLPTCSQLRRPIATGRIAFSARLLIWP
jgi:hypothetical protein